MQFLTGSPPSYVFARSIQSAQRIYDIENIQLIISFQDGSIGTLTYTTLGDPSYSKEEVEVFAGQSVGRLTDYRHLTLLKKGKKYYEKRWLRPDKGFFEELQALVASDNGNFMTSLYSTLTILMAQKSLKTGHDEAILLNDVGF